MNRPLVSRFVLFVAIIWLLSSSVAISRDYQDSWILEGLEIPFVLFVITYVVAFFSEKRMSWMIGLAVISRAVFLLIPNLKYTWFQGIWIDQHLQYALAKHVCNVGHIATQGPFDVSVYGNTPLIHLAFANFSIILNIPVVYAIKYLPVLFSPIYPLLTYMIVKKLRLPQGTTTLKYALFLSAVPPIAQYVVTGSMLGGVLVFLTLSSLIALIQRNDRRYGFVFVFFVCALAAWHSSSSVLLSIFLLTITLLQKISHFRLRSYIKTSIVLVTISISAAWLMFPANFTMEKIVRVFSSGLFGGLTPGSERIPIRFSDLVRVDMLEAIKSILPYYGADVFLLLMTFAGLIVLLKMRKELNDTSKFLAVSEGLLLLFMPIGLLIGVGGFRILHIARLLFPVFSGISIVYLCKKRALASPIILFLIILLATFQCYRCQPLVPSANLLFEDLPKNEPMVYVNLVNSEYQRQMIGFARDHVTGQIALDRITGNQIVGSTDFDFVVTHIGWVYYYPLDKNKLEREYDCFLIHLPGISGGFAERAEIRTRRVILEAIYNSSIAYTNGESYILTHSFALQRY